MCLTTSSWGGITLYLVVCVLRVRASAVACVASVPDGETPMQFVLCCLSLHF